MASIAAVAVPLPRDQDHRDGRVALPYLPENFQARSVRQRGVDDHHVGPMAIQQIDNVGPARRRQHPRLHIAKSAAERLADFEVVVDDQQRQHRAASPRQFPWLPASRRHKPPGLRCRGRKLGQRQHFRRPTCPVKQANPCHL